MKVKFLFVFLLVCTQLYGQDFNKKLTSYVNPFIGTGAVGNSLSGNNYPGATVPFGMIQLSPDTREAPNWDTASGYDYNDKTIVGFSHTHLSGTGVSELFDVLLMPTTGKGFFDPGTKEHPEEGYRSRFSHEQESASPGYYQVQLLDYKINAELTATGHSGFHKYTYPKGESAHLTIDLNHSMNKGNWNGRIINSQLHIINDSTIVGYRLFTGWAKLRKIYFYAKLSQPIIKSSLTDGESISENQQLLNGSNLRAVLDFGTHHTEPLLVKIGFSAVSIANAKENLSLEIADWDFDKTREEASAIWEKQLQKIEIKASEEIKQTFYTALYHTFLQPNNLADKNGDYMATDYTTGKASDGTHYSTFSLWDTYRAAHPLYALLQPKKDVAFINSMIRQYDTYGYLPIWQLWGQENYCMIGNHAIPVIVDAILKNLKGIDVEKAYEAIKNSSTRSHLNSPFETWKKYHYMPENLQSQSVSITLEMAYDDWCVAQLAKKLGKEKDYQHFIERSAYYKNLYDQKTGFFRAKDDQGNWINPFSPLKYGANGGDPFTEGNAWQYFWYVPQDVNGLISLVGGAEQFTSKLDSFFTIKNSHGEINGNASGFIGQYAHGNEPSQHVAYLYNYAGQPWKTQFYVSEILRRFYNNSSSGYAGNEDCGEMSAWYVFSAMGFYPVNPASDTYAIGSPLLNEVIIHLDNGKTFTIKSDRKNKDDNYIHAAKLNGKNLSSPFIHYKDLIAGGMLEFKMKSNPDKHWVSR
ncbi:MAG TPA: GH92 family glycosyl hydrolase [Pelobium sp.]|nr:GH92 family glycosyl hydrolase [Pelobium sp.]